MTALAILTLLVVPVSVLQFLNGLKWKLTENHFQITTDGHHFYRSIQSLFARQCDFAQLVKLLGDYASLRLPKGGTPHQESRR